ncbi:unnamed protein product (macronuclear) [Paramecium tetraurelia]|uniref:t-SNARE coiled-coil homology domain-containing protein n=1 Tax=Paramecium tetraurelia TaxID=5888 RepID=A0D798_PARTE|nr:uncharacterized protein GSPATT00001957001 [Paramecium tetraurelia]CAK78915.1 unnamed protein product [Paramecium tetraurelia]|eukprot:XP_001446312.1 hypothetical protein (macronuclear) [Paramecium tetraurelia strain d4-2]
MIHTPLMNKSNLTYTALYEEQVQIIQNQDQELIKKSEQILFLKNKLSELECKLVDTQGILLNLSTRLCTQISTEMNEIITDQTVRERKSKSFFSFQKPKKNNRQFITYLKKQNK